MIHGGQRRRVVPITCERCGAVVYKRTNGKLKPRFCSVSCSQVTHLAKRFPPEKRKRIFWEHVNKTESCWLWTGPRTGTGYGVFSIAGQRRMTHRWSYEWAHGQIPDGHGVLHKCDVPLCVNPAHLFTGTQADNMRDMLQKGRKDVMAAAAKTRTTRLASPNCRYGHPFDRVLPGGQRYCSTCAKRNRSAACDGSRGQWR